MGDFFGYGVDVSKKTNPQQACQYREQVPRFPISILQPMLSGRLKYRMVQLSRQPTFFIFLFVQGKKSVFCRTNCEKKWNLVEIVRNRAKKNYGCCPRCLSQCRWIYFLGGIAQCEHCCELPSIATLLQKATKLRSAMRLGQFQPIASALRGTRHQQFRASIALGEAQLPPPDNVRREEDFELVRFQPSDYVRVVRTTGRLLYAGGKLSIR